jgi:hypothetical protein
MKGALAAFFSSPEKLPYFTLSFSLAHRQTMQTECGRAMGLLDGEAIQ